MAGKPGHAPEDPEPEPPRWPAVAAAGLLAAAIALAAIGMAVPLGTLNVDTRVGPVGFVLRSNFTESSVAYTGSAPEFGVEVGNTLTFLGGTGEYQERVGFLKGTAKERTNTIEPWTEPQTRFAALNVTLRADTIPWWVVGVDVPCHVTVRLVDWANVSQLRVDSAYIEFHRKVGGAEMTKRAWEVSSDDLFERTGQSFTYSTDLRAPENWGEFDLFGMVNVTMKDKDGSTATHVLRSYSTEPKTIKLWTIPTSQGAKVALTAAAMPATVTGAALAAIGAALVLLTRGRRLALAVTILAAVILVLGAVFFRVGLTELATVLGYPDDLAFKGGYWVVAAAFVPAVGAAGLQGLSLRRWPDRPPERPPKEASG